MEFSNSSGDRSTHAVSELLKAPNLSRLRHLLRSPPPLFLLFLSSGNSNSFKGAQRSTPNSFTSVCELETQERKDHDYATRLNQCLVSRIPSSRQRSHQTPHHPSGSTRTSCPRSLPTSGCTSSPGSVNLDQVDSSLLSSFILPQTPTPPNCSPVSLGVGLSAPFSYLRRETFPLSRDSLSCLSICFRLSLGFSPQLQP